MVPAQVGLGNTFNGEKHQEWIKVDSKTVAELGKASASVSENNQGDEKDCDPRELGYSLFERC